MLRNILVKMNFGIRLNGKFRKLQMKICWPSVVLVTERFTTLAKASMRGNGVPNAPMVVLPKTELTEYVEPDLVRSVATEAVELIVAQLREPKPRETN